jgi:integral membrane protein
MDTSTAPPPPPPASPPSATELLFGTALGRLRVISLLEGLSYVALLGIAMPLKYLAGEPRAVEVVGMAHGGLFLLFCVALMHAWVERRWSLLRPTLAFAAAIVPLGAFALERSLRAEQRAAPDPV